MKPLNVCAPIAALWVVAPSSAAAADALLFGPTPAWVVPQVAPTLPNKASEAPVSLLLSDEQIRLEPARMARFTELALKIQKAEGLGAANLNLEWNPATDVLTVHKVLIRRGDKVIDVLASGQKFTTMRREANLEQATLDGVLTATLLPEDVREGDVINVAMTVVHSDPTLKQHVETGFGSWNGVPVALAHARVLWPAGLNLSIRESSGLPQVQPPVRDGMKSVELVARNVEPLIAPRAAPPRYSVGRIGEATDFKSWAEAAELMAPLYKEASRIPGSGALHDEVETIRISSTDPKKRAEAALALVQNRVRYVALVMGLGGYKPSSAEESWSRRFGDCKAKTALLLGMLNSLGIQAIPVAVRSQGGDMVADRLPMISLFDHVLVRAEIAGKTYWLDGTRTGDSLLDAVEIPDFGCGLPLTQGSKLVPILPSPLPLPNDETRLIIDARPGARATAQITAEQIFRGDGALEMKGSIAQLTDAQKQAFLGAFWKARYDFVSPGETAVKFNSATKEYRLSMQGEGKLDWDHGQFHVPESSVGFSPNFDRSPGPYHDAPIAVAYPAYSRRVIELRLPKGFFGMRGKPPGAVTDTVLAGVAYRVNATNSSDLTGDTITVETTTRSLVPEVPYDEALAAAPRLRKLDGEDVAVPIPGTYKPTKSDLEAMVAAVPTTAAEFAERGQALAAAGRADDALADFGKAIALEPKNAPFLASRAYAEMLRGDYETASNDIAAALAIDPDFIGAVRLRGKLSQEKGEYAQAAEDFAKGVTASPESALDLGNLAEAHHGMKNDVLALEESARALKMMPSLMNLRVMRANILVSRGDLIGAGQEAARLVAENPKSDFAFVAAGKILARVGRQADSLAAFDQALALQPSAFIYVNRAQVRPNSDRRGRIADYDSALKLDPNMSEALSGKAEELTAAGKFSEAVAAYDSLIAKHPDDLGALSGRTVAFAKAGRWAEAKESVARERAAATKAVQFNNMCWDRATANVLLDEALADCEHALRLFPDSAGYLDSLGMVQLRLQHLDQAIATYSKAISAYPYTSSYMGRAIARMGKGDREGASADLREARKLDPKIEERFADYGLRI